MGIGPFRKDLLQPSSIEWEEKQTLRSYRPFRPVKAVGSRRPRPIGRGFRRLHRQGDVLQTPAGRVRFRQQVLDSLTTQIGALLAVDAIAESAEPVKPVPGLTQRRPLGRWLDRR